MRGTAPYIFGHGAMSIDLRAVGLAQISGAGAEKLEIDNNSGERPRRARCRRDDEVAGWPVDDAAACVTMVEFHRQVKKGSAPALALAQRQMRTLSGRADRRTLSCDGRYGGAGPRRRATQGGGCRCPAPGVSRSRRRERRNGGRGPRRPPRECLGAIHTRRRLTEMRQGTVRRQKQSSADSAPHFDGVPSRSHHW